MDYLAGMFSGFLITLLYGYHLVKRDQREEKVAIEDSDNQREIEIIKICQKAMDEKINLWIDEVKRLSREIRKEQ